MTTVVFETAALADVLKKAASIAPTRGMAFDKAAGLMITVFPEAEAQHAIIQATNLDIWYKEWVPILSCDAPREMQWRVSSKIAAVIATLPIGSGKTVELSDDAKPNAVTVKSGRMKNNWQLLPAGYYPEWETFDPDGLTIVENFGSRLGMVEWAASKNDAEVPFNGVYMDGQYVVATDGYKLARIPLTIDAGWMTDKGGIVIPARGVSTLMKTGAVSLGVTETQLLLMPDPSIQIRTSLLAEPYKVAGVNKIIANEYDGELNVSKAALLELLNRSMVLIDRERFPLIDLFIGKGEIAVYVIDQESGDMGEPMEVAGAGHKRINYIFTPQLLIEAIDNCPTDHIKICYSTTDPKRIVRITGSDYNAWVIPRRNRPTAAEQAGEA